MQCTFIKEDGLQCQAMAIKESSYCFSHNPDTQEEKHLAVVQGGMARKNSEVNLPAVELKTPQQVVSLLAETINQVRAGQVPPQIANTVGFLAGHMLKAMEVANLDQRLELVESVLIERKRAIRRTR